MVVWFTEILLITIHIIDAHIYILALSVMPTYIINNQLILSLHHYVISLLIHFPANIEIPLFHFFK